MDGLGYSIGQVSQMTGLPVSTLRYYDKEGLFPQLQRVSGSRRFSDREIDALNIIECLKKSGLEIKDIKLFMGWCAQGPSSYPQRLELFQQQRDAVEAEMTRMEKVHDTLNYKCWYYEQALATGREPSADERPVINAKAPGRSQHPSAILAHLAAPETAVVFDIDGVLARYEFGNLQHGAEVEGDWEAYVREANPYAAIPPAPPLQRFISAKDPHKVFACSVAADYEEPGKRDFVLRHYDIPADHVIMVRSKDQKIAVLDQIAQDQGLDPLQVVLVEDTVKTLDVAAAKGFATCHVSSFLAW